MMRIIYDEVSEQAETAMQMIEEKLGKNNFLIVSEKHTLASICITKAEHTPDKEEASELFGKAETLEADCLAILTATLGDHNPFTASIFMNIGVVFRESGKNSEAEEMLTKALEIRQKILGESFGVAVSHNHLATFYFENIKEYEKAESHFIQNMEIYEKLHGPA